MTTGSGLSLQRLDRRNVNYPAVSVLIVSKSSIVRTFLSEHVSNSLPEPCDFQHTSSQDQALRLVEKSSPNILLIDLMPGEIPLLDFGQRLGYRAAVIFVCDKSAAQAAFDAGAIDCVQSPVKPERLERAMQRAMTWVSGSLTDPPAAIDLLARNEMVTAGKRARWLRILRSGDVLFAHLDHVLYMQADRKTTRVVLESTEGYLRLGINTVAESLDSNHFVRIHRGTLVNANHISVVQQDDLGRVVVRLLGRTEKLYASRAHERALLRDGIF